MAVNKFNPFNIQTPESGEFRVAQENVMRSSYNPFGDAKPIQPGFFDELGIAVGVGAEEVVDELTYGIIKPDIIPEWIEKQYPRATAIGRVGGTIGGVVGSMLVTGGAIGQIGKLAKFGGVVGKIGVGAEYINFAKAHRLNPLISAGSRAKSGAIFDSAIGGTRSFVKEITRQVQERDPDGVELAKRVVEDSFMFGIMGSVGSAASASGRVTRSLASGTTLASTDLLVQSMSGESLDFGQAAKSFAIGATFEFLTSRKIDKDKAIERALKSGDNMHVILNPYASSTDVNAAKKEIKSYMKQFGQEGDQWFNSFIEYTEQVRIGASKAKAFGTNYVSTPYNWKVGKGGKTLVYSKPTIKTEPPVPIGPIGDVPQSESTTVNKALGTIFNPRNPTKKTVYSKPNVHPAPAEMPGPGIKRTKMSNDAFFRSHEGRPTARKEKLLNKTIGTPEAREKNLGATFEPTRGGNFGDAVGNAAFDNTGVVSVGGRGPSGSGEFPGVTPIPAKTPSPTVQISVPVKQINEAKSFGRELWNTWRKYGEVVGVKSDKQLQQGYEKMLKILQPMSTKKGAEGLTTQEQKFLIQSLEEFMEITNKTGKNFKIRNWKEPNPLTEKVTPSDVMIYKMGTGDMVEPVKVRKEFMDLEMSDLVTWFGFQRERWLTASGTKFGEKIKTHAQGDSPQALKDLHKYLEYVEGKGDPKWNPSKITDPIKREVFEDLAFFRQAMLNRTNSYRLFMGQEPIKGIEGYVRRVYKFVGEAEKESMRASGFISLKKKDTEVSLPERLSNPTEKLRTRDIVPLEELISDPFQSLRFNVKV